MISKAIVLYSGGMDSTVLLHQALKENDEVYVLTFDYGQKHKIETEKTIISIKSLPEELHSKIKDHQIVNMSFLGKMLTNCALTNKDVAVPNMKDVVGEAQTVCYVPNRNMIFLSIASSYAENCKASKVYYGAVAVDNLSGFWDCTAEFLESINKVLEWNRLNQIKIDAPLLYSSKSEIIQKGIDLGVNFKNTWTCYNPQRIEVEPPKWSNLTWTKEVADGKCPSCAARIAGFIKLGVIDPIDYINPIDWLKYNCKPLS